MPPNLFETNPERAKPIELHVVQSDGDRIEKRKREDDLERILSFSQYPLFLAFTQLQKRGRKTFFLMLRNLPAEKKEKDEAQSESSAIF